MVCVEPKGGGQRAPGFSRVIYAAELPGIVFDAIMDSLCNPRATALVPPDTVDAARIVLGQPAVSDVLGMRNVAEIGDCVIRDVAVCMVDHAARPAAMMENPSGPVRVNYFVQNPTVEISRRVRRIQCAFPRMASVPRRPHPITSKKIAVAALP